MTAKLPEFDCCPYCGERDHAPSLLTAQLFGLPYHGVEGNLSIAYDSFGWTWVECHECVAQGPKVKAPRTTRDNDKMRRAMVNAVEAWNRRKTQMQLDFGKEESA